MLASTFTMVKAVRCIRCNAPRYVDISEQWQADYMTSNPLAGLCDSCMKEDQNNRHGYFIDDDQEDTKFERNKELEEMAKQQKSNKWIDENV